MATTRAFLHRSALAALVLVLGCQSDSSQTPATDAVARPARTVGAGEGDANAFGRDAKNFLSSNGGFEEWPDGDTALPAGWRIVEAETASQIGRATKKDEVHDGKSALRITSEPHVISVTSNGTTISDEANTVLRGRPMTAGVWAKASEPGAAFINIRDGINQSNVVDHPGDGEWHFITVTYTLDPGASEASVRLGNRKQDGTTPVFFDGAVLLSGEQPPTALDPKAK